MKLDSVDRKILLAAFGVLVVTLIISALLGTPSQQAASPYPSPYSTASGGAKAAYELLPQLGYQERHWRHSPDKLLEEAGADTVLIIGVPTQNATPEDRSAISRYVQAGGKVLAIGASSLRLLPHQSATVGVPHFAWQEYGALLPSRITNNAGEIALASSGAYWNLNDFDSEVQYGDDKLGVVASYSYGKGEVIWWASPDPLTNSGLLQRQNLQMFLNSLGPPSRAVLWDDYFHEGEATLYDSLLHSPLKWALLQLGLLALAIVWTYSRRNGPVRALPVRTRLAPLEFVESLGSLYRHAKVPDVAVEVAYQRFRHLLHRKLGISVSTSPEQLAVRVEAKLGKPAPKFQEMIASCEASRYRTDLPESDALALVGSLAKYSEDLKLTGPKQGAKWAQPRN